jgi:hypothetical protein
VLRAISRDSAASLHLSHHSPRLPSLLQMDPVVPPPAWLGSSLSGATPPNWSPPASPRAPPATNWAPPPATVILSSPSSRADMTWWIRFFRTINILAAILLIITSVFSILSFASVNRVIMACYAIFFSILIMVYEFNWFHISVVYYFGFLVTPIYRALFQVMLGIQAWSMGGILAFACGLVFFGTGLLHLIVLLCNALCSEEVE